MSERARLDHCCRLKMIWRDETGEEEKKTRKIRLEHFRITHTSFSSLVIILGCVTRPIASCLQCSCHRSPHALAHPLLCVCHHHQQKPTDGILIWLKVPSFTDLSHDFCIYNIRMPLLSLRNATNRLCVAPYLFIFSSAMACVCSLFTVHILIGSRPLPALFVVSWGDLVEWRRQPNRNQPANRTEYEKKRNLLSLRQTGVETRWRKIECGHLVVMFCWLLLLSPPPCENRNRNCVGIVFYSPAFQLRMVRKKEIEIVAGRT